MKSFLIVFLILATALAFAEGSMFRMNVMEPHRLEKPAATPVQRAVVKWDGETETLLLESTLAGPRGSYGWVVPLPTRPSFVKAVKPEYIRGSFAQLTPPIKRLPQRDLRLPIAASLFVSVLLLSSGLRYRKLSPAARLPLFFGELVIAAVVMVAAFPGDPPSAPVVTAGEVFREQAKSSFFERSVQVESLGTIGSYEVSVLDSDDGSELAGWLRDRKIDVPEDAQGVLGDYVRDGWCFLVAEFRKEEDRPLPPHPLKAVFPTREPVYPLRLTGTQDQPMRLEMIVVGNRRAEVPGLDAWICNDQPLLVNVFRDPKLDATIYDEWKGSLYAMAKDGDVVTYLRGDLEPSQMRRDLEIEWKPSRFFSLDAFDRQEAVRHAFDLAFLWLPAVATLFGLISVVFPSRAGLTFAVGAVLSLVAAGGVAGSWMGSIATVETSVSRYPLYPVKGHPYMPIR